MTTIRDMIAVDDQKNPNIVEQNNASIGHADPFARHVDAQIKKAKENLYVTAPEVFAEESFPDVNIVSEYIDGTLSESSLCREYEDACLNDVVLLAELVDCVKWSDALAQGVKMTIPEHCRHRLYYAQNRQNNILTSNTLADEAVLGTDCGSGDAFRDDCQTANNRQDILEQQNDKCTQNQNEIEVNNNRPVSTESPACTVPVDLDAANNHVSSLANETCSDTANNMNNMSRVSSKRYEGKKIIQGFYRTLVMTALIGIVVLFLRLPPEERQENLSRLRNIWTLFQIDKDHSGEAVDGPGLPALNHGPNDRFDSGNISDTHGDFPLPTYPISSRSPQKEAITEDAATLPSSPLKEVSLQPSFVIPGQNDLLQSNPDLLR